MSVCLLSISATAFDTSWCGGLPGWKLCERQIYMMIGCFSYRQRDAKIGIRSEVEAPFRHDS